MKKFYALFEDATLEEIEAESIEQSFQKAYTLKPDAVLLAVCHNKKLAEELVKTYLEDIKWQ